jgi:hypothetical protein
MSENTSPMEVPTALLSQALLDLRAARGKPQAAREAAIRYFKSGIEGGFQVESLLRWLFFWPNDSDSVFCQVRFQGNEGGQFIEMLKKLSLRDLGVAPDECAAPNDGPATHSGNSGASEGPPSAS